MRARFRASVALIPTLSLPVSVLLRSFTLQLVKAYNSVVGRASPSTISYNTRKDVVLVGDVLGLVKILDGISGLSLIPVDVAGQAAPAESEDGAFLGIKEDDAGNKTVAV